MPLSADAIALVWLAAATWAADLGLVGLTGAVACRLLLPDGGGLAADAAFRQAADAAFRQAADAAPHQAADAALGRKPAAAERRLAAFAAVCGALLLMGAGARLGAQTWSIFGPDEPVTLDLLRIVGVESRWGARWRPQAVLALAAAAGAALWVWRPRVGWPLAGLAAAGAWAALPLTGHAMSAASPPLPWGLQSLHGLSAGLWIGTLAALVAVAFRLARDPRGDAAIERLVRRFSPLALGAVAGVVLSGAVTAVLYVDAPADLWTTAWGRALLLKVALFAAAGAVGARNWRRLTPRLGDAAATRALLRSASVELALAVGLLAVTAFLVHLAAPAPAH